MLKQWLTKFRSPNENSSASANKQFLHTGDLIKTKEQLTSLFGNTSDLIIENILIGDRKGLLCYLSTLTTWQVVTEKVLQPLTTAAGHNKEINTDEEFISFCHNYFSGSQHQVTHQQQKIVENIVSGQAIIFPENIHQVLAIQIITVNKRGIEEPSTQTIVRGPKEGFIEDIETNLSLVRKRIKNPSLRFEEHYIGSETITKISIAYIDGIIKQKVLKELQNRIAQIKANALFDSGNLEEFLTDKSFTPFPLLYNTERPDTIAAHLITGKFAIFVDGSPFILTAPVTFHDFVSMSEDYYQQFMMGSFVRLIRYLAFLIALLLPSFYVAVITFHHEMIPTQLLISIISQREGIPFPAVVEAIIMEITFEILREAGIRMPRAVGGTISIVGGLVIGQAAVEAGIVSNIMVIIVALTAISSFVAPIYNFAIATRLLRFLFIIVGSILGLYGVFLGMIFLVLHLTSLRSFGIPYLAPIAPFHLADHSDIFVRLPIWVVKKRPSYLETEKPIKQPASKSPSPPQKRGEED